MIKRWRERSEFSKHVLTLMTGTTIGQAIPIAISPILTRLYTPQEFGLYALFVSLVTIFGTIVNGRYELAVLLPDTDEEAMQVMTVGLCINVMMAVSLCLAVWGFSGEIVELLGSREILPWLWLVPAIVFVMGGYNLMYYYANRKKAFSGMSVTSVVKAAVMGTVQIVGGLIFQGVTGLISGQVFSQLAGVFTIFGTIKRRGIPKPRFRVSQLLASANRFKKFPLFSMPAVLANVLSRHSLNLLITAFFNLATLGYFALAQRFLGLPSTLAGTAVSQVFYQKAVELRASGKGVAALFNATIFKLLLAAFPVYATMFFIAEDLFAFVFGEAWRVAGTYASILTPLFAMQFISASLALITSVYEKQAQSLVINLSLLIGSVGLLVAARWMQWEFELFLVRYSVVMGALYFGFLVYYRFLSREP